MTHDTHLTPHIHAHTQPSYLGACEEDLSNERRGLLHRGHLYHIHTDGHRDSMTESAQWADSVKKNLSSHIVVKAGNLHINSHYSYIYNQFFVQTVCWGSLCWVARVLLTRGGATGRRR